MVLGNYEFIPATVTSVSNFTMEGAFVPLTLEGNMVVDGVLASCYASCDHDLAHIAMLPLQLFPTKVGWIFGEDDTFSTFVDIVNDLGAWMTPTVYFL